MIYNIQIYTQRFYIDIIYIYIDIQILSAILSRILCLIFSGILSAPFRQ